MRKGFQPCWCVFLSPQSIHARINTGRFNLLRAGVRYAEETWWTFFGGNFCLSGVNGPQVCNAVLDTSFVFTMSKLNRLDSYYMNHEPKLEIHATLCLVNVQHLRFMMIVVEVFIPQHDRDLCLQWAFRTEMTPQSWQTAQMAWQRPYSHGLTLSPFYSHRLEGHPFRKEQFGDMASRDKSARIWKVFIWSDLIWDDMSSLINRIFRTRNLNFKKVCIMQVIHEISG